MLLNSREGMKRWKLMDAGARQRVSAFWQALADRDPMLNSAVLTVEMVIAGQVYSFARVPVATTSSSTGFKSSYVPALTKEPGAAEGVSLGNNAAQARSASFSVQAQAIDVDAALLRGGVLAGTAEISLQVDGGDYDLRLVLMRGVVSGGVTFGDGGEVISFTVSDPRSIQESKVPDQLIDTVSWPMAQEEVIGERVTRVYNGCTAIPCPRVLDDFGGTGLYFAVCDTPDEYSIDKLYVNGEQYLTTDSPYQWSVATVEDSLGRRVLVTSHGGSTGPWEDGDAVNVTMTRKASTKLLGVLDIVEDLLGSYTGLGRMGLNLDLFAFAQTRIAPTSPEVVINASGENTPGVMSFVERGLLGSYPMVHMLYSGAGIGVTVIDRRRGRGGSGYTGSYTGRRFPLFDRLSGYQESALGSLFTDYEVRYAYNPMARAHTGIVSRGPEDSPICRLAERWAGGRQPGPFVESPFIKSEADALYVLDWYVAHYSVPHYRVTWSCAPAMWMTSKIGQNITYTDPERPAFTECDATIVGRSYSRGECTLTLMVWHPVLTQGFARNA